MRFGALQMALFCILSTFCSVSVFAFSENVALSSCFIEFRINNVKVHSCSGTAVNSRRLLTAGHCILFGGIYINADDFQTIVRCPNEPANEYRVVKGYLHPYMSKNIVSNSTAGLPAEVIKEFRDLKLVGQGLDPNIDIGFMEIESSKSFPGPFPKLALSRTEFAKAITGSCYLRGFRGDFVNQVPSNKIDSAVFLRQILEIKKSPNDKFGYNVDTVPKESYIYQGDSGASVLCASQKDKSESVVATVSGASSAVVSIYQNAAFIKTVLAGDAVPEFWGVPSVFNIDILNTKRKILRLTSELKSKENVSVNCDLEDIEELKACRELVIRTTKLIENIDPRYKFLVPNKIIQFTNRKNIWRDGIPAYNEARFSLPKGESEMASEGFNPYTDEKLIRFLSSPLPR